jgi:hypothetical protein
MGVERNKPLEDLRKQMLAILNYGIAKYEALVNNKAPRSDGKFYRELPEVEKIRLNSQLDSLRVQKDLIEGKKVSAGQISDAMNKIREASIRQIAMEDKATREKQIRELEEYYQKIKPYLSEKAQEATETFVSAARKVKPSDYTEEMQE